MNTARTLLSIALLACSGYAAAQSLAVRVDAPDWGQVDAVQPLGSEGTVWSEHCHAAGVQDHAQARYVDARGRTLGSAREREAWLASIEANDILQGKLGPVVRVNEDTPPTKPGQVVLRSDREGTLDRDLACLASATAMGDLLGHDVWATSGGRQYKWTLPAGFIVPQVGAFVRAPSHAVMAGYAPGHTPPNPPRGDWSDGYYIGYPYAERYQAPVVD